MAWHAESSRYEQRRSEKLSHRRTTIQTGSDDFDADRRRGLIPTFGAGN